MLWSGVVHMSGLGVGNSAFIEGILNADRYLSILKEDMKRNTKKWAFYTVFIFIKTMSQNIRLVKSKNSSFIIAQNRFRPHQSPDINPIENLWDELDREVHTTLISSLTELRRRLKEE